MGKSCQTFPSSQSPFEVPPPPVVPCLSRIESLKSICQITTQLHLRIPFPPSNVCLGEFSNFPTSVALHHHLFFFLVEFRKAFLQQILFMEIRPKLSRRGFSEIFQRELGFSNPRSSDHRISGSEVIVISLDLFSSSIHQKDCSFIVFLLLLLFLAVSLFD